MQQAELLPKQKTESSPSIRPESMLRGSRFFRLFQFSLGQSSDSVGPSTQRTFSLKQQCDLNQYHGNDSSLKDHGSEPHSPSCNYQPHLR